ncbi:hypothetical protein TSUD_365410 [Trifolium subterraneum]|uniref:DNA-directed RNA polymerase n=1 Tax=Trifolium subterraneum TaxID=3900 RepID=A0A2Z6N1M7_TRISU|nr:hypothetical protein TSUD_365410 [Trifolium subterraneum]
MNLDDKGSNGITFEFFMALQEICVCVWEDGKQRRCRPYGIVADRDPRISSASIIWVNPGTNTWVRNPSKSSNGELALDVILEKEAVKQSGDAWRIVLDSCLPVLHLIDTRRSIPYAIKQIQELLGISCTFDQAIQRLAASVRMVAKGVLREHLILLASSMTCGGNLVGFNTGGYKTLARQLNIQVPFTDATLFTPRKCFERAAEKHHADSLSSIVASCSWGKHVAVGTGSRFDIVWDPKEINTNEIEGMNVYNFLHMVKGLANGEEENNACLGEDIDDLLDEENVDWDMSPQHTSGFDAVFDETFELLNGPTSNGWDSNKDQIDQTKTNSNDWSGWGQKKSEIQDSSKSSGWGAATNQNSESSWGKKGGEDGAVQNTQWESGIQEDSSKSSAWGAATNQNNDKSWGKTKPVAQDAVQTTQWESGIQENSSKSSAWGAATNKSNDHIQEDSSKSGAWGAATNQNSDQSDGPQKATWVSGSSQKSSAWGAATNKSNDHIQEDSSKSGAWGAATNQNSDQSDGPQKWRSEVAQKDSSKSGAWEANTIQNSGQSSWGKNKTAVVDAGEEMAHKESGSITKWKADGIQENLSNSGGWKAWGNSKPDVRQGESIKVQDSWNSQKSKAGADVTEEDSAKSSAWGKSKSPENPNSSWGKPKSPENPNSSWGKPKSPENQPLDNKNESNSSWGKPKSQENQPWDSKTEPNSSSSWGKPKSQENQPWDSKTEPNSSSWGKPKSQENQPWDSKTEPNSSSWGKPKSQENQPWTKNDSNQSASSRGWDSHVASANSDGDRSFQWGKQGRDSFKKNQFEGSQGRGSNAGDWRNQNRPTRAPGQRFELYSSEEQDVLKHIEPIVQSIRKIMQQEGYNDGDPLAADDQKYVLENVFEHHPDKETKMGAGIDHVMVSRHSNFQDSRCLYVVLKDGKKEDFSYRKCLENLVRKTFPETAESFCGKYFRKPQPRVKRDQTPNPAGGEQTANPNPAGEQTATPNPAGEQTTTPAGDQTSTPNPAEDQNTTPMVMETNE